MKTQQKIWVTGVTGQQGMAVAKNLLLHNFEVYGLTRNINSTKAIELKSLGVRLVQGDLDQVSTFKNHLTDMDVTFLMQSFEQGYKKEIQQARRFIEAHQKEGVKHLVYSSVLGADLNTGVPHFDSKHEIEKFIQKTGISYTIVRPASFMENFLIPDVSKRIVKGSFMSPLNKTVVQQHIAINDIGKVVAHICSNLSKYKQKIISIATDELSVEEVAGLFTEVLGKSIQYKKLPDILTFIFMGKDLYKMFSYMNKNNFKVIKDINAVKNEFGLTGNFKYWIKNDFITRTK